MRAALLLAAVIIADAIRPDATHSEAAKSFTFWVLVVMFLMDLAEFAK